MNLRAYPLCWPQGWKRIETWRRTNGRFSSNNRMVTVSDGCGRIIAELTKLGIKRYDMIISTNVETRLDGLPRSDRSNPADPGVAVYWRKGQNGPMKCMATDRYRAVADNLCAIAATLEAMRAIERHGGAEILDRAFTGFAALPERTGVNWRSILGLNEAADVTAERIDTRFRMLARERHPDRGGSDVAMAELNLAREAALAEVTS